MVNKEIITALQNAVSHGESLETAIQILVNSGYPLEEVRKASAYIGKRITPNLKEKPGEQLTMPEKKGFFSKFKKKKKPENLILSQKSMQKTAQIIKKEISPGLIKSTENTNLPQKQQSNQVQQNNIIQQPQPSTQQTQHLNTNTLQNIKEDKKKNKIIKPVKFKYFKEVFLLIVLLVLILILISTILFRSSILGFFS